jgi:signal peptidase I
MLSRLKHPFRRSDQSWPVLTPPKKPSATVYSNWRTRRTVLTVGLIILIAPLVVVALTSWFFQQYQVLGQSMQPTLYNANRLIVLKLPKTWSNITGHPFVPGRGDIIIFIPPSDISPSQAGSDQLVKRVIGLPGDRVVIAGGMVTIYNSTHPNGFDPDRTLPYGKDIGYTSGNLSLIVPPNKVYVLGDNRANAIDSRVFGPVPVKSIIGKVVVRIAPVSNLEDF